MSNCCDDTSKKDQECCAEDRSEECCGECKECEACCGACGGDPAECAVLMWTSSFFNALRQVQTEMLKSKIEKAWGAKMEKAADAVLENMEAKWQAMLSGKKAHDDLKSKLASLWRE